MIRLAPPLFTGYMVIGETMIMLFGFILLNSNKIACREAAQRYPTHVGLFFKGDIDFLY